MTSELSQIFAAASRRVESNPTGIGLYAAAQEFVTGGYFEYFAVAVLFLLVLMMFIFGLLSGPQGGSVNSALYKIGMGPSARNLFLFISYGHWSIPPKVHPSRFYDKTFRMISQPENSDQGTKFHGYLRTLSLGEALIVATARHKKGDVVRLNIGSLPGYPESSSTLVGQVKSSRQIHGDPNHFFVRVSLTQQSNVDSRNLLDYLRGLSHKPSAMTRV